MPPPYPMNQMIPHRQPMLPRRSSFPQLSLNHHNWPVAGSLNHDGHLLGRFLPQLAHLAYHKNLPAEIVGHELALHSDGVVENGGTPGLSLRKLDEAYASIIQLVRTSHSDRDVAIIISDYLRSHHEKDETHIQCARQESHIQSLSCFRALSEVSRQTSSLCIGDILLGFFLTNGMSILDSDELGDILMWAYAIYRATMQPDEKMLCLKTIVEYDPDIFNSLDYYRFPDHLNFERELARAADHFGNGYINPRGRNRRRFYERRLYSPGRSPDYWGGRNVRRRYTSSRDLRRARSAPGDRQIVRQADRVIEAAEEMRDEAEILRELAARR